MNIKKSIPTTYKKIIIPIIVLVVLGVGVSTYALMQSSSDTPANNNQTAAPNPVNTVDYSDPSSNQKDTGDKTKQNTVNSSDTSNIKTDRTVTITALQQNNNVLQARSYIDTVVTTGTCTLTLTNAASTVTKQASIQSTADISTCQGFDVNMSELSTGQWSVKIQYKLDTGTYEATSSVQVQ